MQLGLSLGLAASALSQAMRDATFIETLTNSDGETVYFSNGLPVRLARPVGATLLRNSRGEVIVNSAGAAIYQV
jgi:hypothetical protein